VIQVKPVSSTLHVSLVLKHPILNGWTSVPGQFFRMIYDALEGVLPVKSNEFSLAPSTQLGDVKAKYAIYGGASTVTLSPDALLLDFPRLLPADTPIVQQILVAVHDAFPKAFPKLSYSTIEVRSFEHLEFIDAEQSPGDYLTRFTFPNAQKKLVEEAIIFQPGGKCEIVAQDQSWKCALAVEKSIPNARAIFVAITFSMYNLDPASPYVIKQQLAQKITGYCYQLLGLEVSNAAQ
jgi:hypothetical protein